ncbi:Dixdc1 [Columba guinea]|nr:Dixdc1 [Columba guinea]
MEEEATWAIAAAAGDHGTNVRHETQQHQPGRKVPTYEDVQEFPVYATVSKPKSVKQDDSIHYADIQVFTKVRERSAAEQQLQAYVAWVNSQLKKQPTIKPVQDLRQDLRDGVVLALLIEIVAGEKLNGIRVNPTSQQEMRENVEKVLQFVASKKIRMHQTSAKGVRQDVLRSGRDVFRHRQRNSSMDEEIENPYWSVRALVQQYEGQQNVPLESHSASLTSPSPIHSAKSESTVAPSEEKERLVIIHTEETETKTALAPYLRSERKQLALLPSHPMGALLLNGSLPEDEQEGSFELCERGACPEEQLIIIRSRLDQSVEENQDLKKELLKYKQEARNLQGIKDALQQRLIQQDASVLQLKQELLRANMDKEELHNQNVDLQRKVEERNRLLAEYKKELCQKDRHLQQHQSKLDDMLRQLSEASYQQVDLEQMLEHKHALLAHCMKREAEEVMAYSSHSAQSNGFLQTAGKGAAPTAHRGTNDLQLVRDALRSLRNSFSGHDPQHHTIDSLEQGISSLMERLYHMETQERQERMIRGKSPANRATNECRDSWPPKSKLPHSHSTPVMSTSACTKVLYFTDRSLTPFMVNIPKRLGEVTLKDFKVAIDREGTHRYHFKALDPEFGTVKEEVFHDDDIIPGWEGKIVAWVEEDHGEN